ncbi:hypothetical protein BDN72DRAFT_194501 [Pluteus cervinus]|uniref:Uncharacterized protein n=1 Tax=Pluteus cervinus TaxID=181527 RepID=A0ACD3AIU3_9AGAR|nr:hypothetical protein BDN72DRAFT_194501 [Pluteus cervinus]
MVALRYDWCGTTVNLRAWVNSPKTGGLSPCLCLSLSGFRKSQTNSRLWANELSNLPLSELHLFQTNCDLGPGPWEDIFGPLQGLKTVQVEDDAGVGFLEHLMENYEDTCPSRDDSDIEVDKSDESQAGALHSWPKSTFRNLTDLRLMGFDITRTIDVRGLFDCLCVRHHHGLGLDDLTIFDCSGEELEELVTKLDGIVPTVTWDGRLS